MKNEIQIYKNNKSIDIKRTAWSSLSEESQKAYQSDFNIFFKYINKNPNQITSTDILEYIQHLEKEGLKNSSINRKIASLSKMFHILEISGEIKKNPVEILKELKNISHKTSREIKVSLTIDDIRKVTKINNNSSIQEKKMSLIIRFLSMTGLRISEFTGIKNKDIVDYDKENKKIRIIGKGNKERWIFLSNILLKEIKELWPDIESIDYLFYTIRKHRYHRGQLWRQIHEKFKDKINVDGHPHLLRHFMATYLINVKKRDIKAVSLALGHSDVSITLSAYVDTSLSVKESEIKI